MVNLYAVYCKIKFLQICGFCQNWKSFSHLRIEYNFCLFCLFDLILYVPSPPPSSAQEVGSNPD